ncbi:hypothetical protein [Motilimonas eburnea]|uniref:hypothetical protein n=1 Tax=Motilimonas eburnea TaxID=1737488 RepID=UPI001E61AF03|nr:hypothetical protein [Motilimonas eburnea]MCE2570759.1 hypothetical protein [Motilimonas eburnea]
MTQLAPITNEYDGAFNASAKLHQYQELEQIYNQTFGQGIRTLAVVGCAPKEGVTTLISALAERTLLAGKSTLVVDLNLHHPSLARLLPSQDTATNTDISTQDNQAELVSINHSQSVFTGICISQRREWLQKCREPQFLKQQLAGWLEEFDHVLVDTSALNQRNQQNIPAELVAAAAQGCVLVAQAGQSTEGMLQSALARLDEASANLLGCVINDQYNPRLADEICREVRRLQNKLPKLAAWLCQRVKQTRLLNTEI